MSNKNLIVNTPEPKPGILERGDLFAIAVGMVIGSGMVTLIGPAMAMTGYCKCRRTGSVYEACNSNSEQLFCTGIRLVCK